MTASREYPNDDPREPLTHAKDLGPRLIAGTNDLGRIGQEMIDLELRARDGKQSPQDARSEYEHLHAEMMKIIGTWINPRPK